MSRVGHSIDNSLTEGLWGIIKSEMYKMSEVIVEELNYEFPIIYPNPKNRRIEK